MAESQVTRQETNQLRVPPDAPEMRVHVLRVKSSQEIIVREGRPKGKVRQVALERTPISREWEEDGLMEFWHKVSEAQERAPDGCLNGKYDPISGRLWLVDDQGTCLNNIRADTEKEKIEKIEKKQKKKEEEKLKDEVFDLMAKLLRVQLDKMRVEKKNEELDEELERWYRKYKEEMWAHFEYSEKVEDKIKKGKKKLATAVEATLSELDCKICQEPLISPHALECGHVFCYVCLINWKDSYWTRVVDSHHVPCPQCKVSCR